MKGSYLLDGMMSMLGIILMTIFVINHAAVYQKFAHETLEDRILYHKVFETSEWLVKRKATIKESGISYENLLDPRYFDSEGNPQGELKDEIEEARQELGLATLIVSLDRPQQGRVCLYRLAIIGEKKPENLRRVFICGS